MPLHASSSAGLIAWNWKMFEFEFEFEFEGRAGNDGNAGQIMSNDHGAGGQQWCADRERQIRAPTRAAAHSIQQSFN